MTRRTARQRSRATVPELIARKRDGEKLGREEIRRLVRDYTNGQIPDYQMSALAMAVLLRGMDRDETATLTLAMRDSGKRARIPVRGPKIDKHSTGGVGDKVSICLAPWVAACGVHVPMIAGRGLGHTGGTLDKLEAIDGFRVDLSLGRFERLVERLGLAIIGQTKDLAPADRKLYALRDVTATVESVPLITASILSKKLCEDLDGLVLDVKVGRGAFMKTVAEARELARSIVRVGAAAGTPVTALLTRMDQPLGRAVGNALETREAIELLHGEAPDDLMEVTLALGAEMLRLARVSPNRTTAERLLLRTLRSGLPRAKLAAMVAAQGGDRRVVDEPDRLPEAPHRSTVRADREGFVRDVDAMAVARICLRLGAGRTRADQEIDPAVGLRLLKKPGKAVKEGEPLAELHLRKPGQATAARQALREAITLGARRPTLHEVVVETIRGRRMAR
ncbi:MAG: thymidine phosphorylase [Myxococcales bacterium]|jgi:pyrimidine-nucleoside phosphorylase